MEAKQICKPLGLWERPNTWKMFNTGGTIVPNEF
jgi:hypothetical protein